MTSRLRKYVPAFMALVPAWCLAVDIAHADAQPAGVVLAASGTVTAQGADQQARSLGRRSPFFAGDVLRTGADARAQLRFRDGALLALRPGSELRIDAYQFTEGKGDADGNRSAATLLKGGLRTITGAIGKQDPDAYKVSTPVATIGVRGTHYEAVLKDSGLAVAAWGGSIVVENGGGTIALGADQAYAFAEISSPDQSPQGMLEPPAVLQSGMEPETTTDADASGADPAASGTTTDDTEGQTSTGAMADSLATTGSDTDAPLAMDDTLTGGGLTGPCETCDPPQETTTDEVKELLPSKDLRFTDAEWNQLQGSPLVGMMVLGGPNSMPTDAGGIFGGQAILADTSGSPVIADRGIGPDDPGFFTAPIEKVFRQGEALLTSGPANPYGVVWGEWNGQIGPGPISVQTDAADPAVVSPLYKPVWFLVTAVTEPTALAARTGIVDYNVPVGVIGNGSGGPVNYLSLSASVDFTNGLLTRGNMYILNADSWDVSFKGKLNSGYIDIDPASLKGVVNGAGDVQGTIGAMVIGNNAQAISGGFDLEKVGDPNTHVEGAFIVECAAPPTC